MREMKTYKDRLKTYISEDEIYKKYKKGETNFNDFDKFCIQHCADIEEILQDNQILRIKASARETEYYKLKEVIDKAIEKINDYKIYCEENKGFTEYTDIEIEAIEPVISKLEDILKEG